MRDLDPTRAMLRVALLLVSLSAFDQRVMGQESLHAIPASDSRTAQNSQAETPATERIAAIAAAIEALGAPSFAARRQAESWLLAREHEAYDALLEAKNHANPEIRLAVLELLDRQQILWNRPTDTPDIAALLENYGNLNSADRFVILQRLSKLDSLSGRVTLARLARYEPSEELSQRAALLLCNALPPLTPATPRTSGSETDPETDLVESSPPDHFLPPWCRDLQRELSGGDRPALVWLRTQLQWQADPLSASTVARTQAEARWKQHLGAASVSRSERALTLELLRWSIRLADAAGDPQAFDDINRFDDLLQEDGVAIREHLDWLASHGRWLEIIAWGERQSERMHLFPEAALRVAEAWYRQGQPAHAETAIQVAMLAFPKGFEDLETLAHGMAHQGYAQTASLLLERALARTPVGSPERLRVVTDLATWDQTAGLESVGAARLTELLDEFDQLNDSSRLVTPAELDQLRAFQQGLLAQAEARKAGHWTKLTGDDRQRFLELLDAAWNLAPEQSGWLELGIAAAETWNHPSLAQWEPRHRAAIDLAQQRINDCEHRLRATPADAMRFRLERSLKQQQLALAQLQLAQTQTRAAGLALLEALTSDRQVAAVAWERLAQARQDAGDLKGALVAARQAAQLTPRAIAQVAATEQLLRQSESRSAARDSTSSQRQ